jgi:hypothetical protein
MARDHASILTESDAPAEGPRIPSAATPRREPHVLEMRPTCERCDTALDPGGAAVICSYECTFCTDCRDQLSGRCPNCGGELVARPRRAPT